MNHPFITGVLIGWAGASLLLLSLPTEAARYRLSLLQSRLQYRLNRQGRLPW